MTAPQALPAVRARRRAASVLAILTFGLVLWFGAFFWVWAGTWSVDGIDSMRDWWFELAVPRSARSLLVSIPLGLGAASPLRRRFRFGRRG